MAFTMVIYIFTLIKSASEQILDVLVDSDMLYSELIMLTLMLYSELIIFNLM